MRTDTRNLLSVSDLSKNVSKVVASASSGTTHVILNNNRPTAALIDIASAERLACIDEIEEDLKLVTATLVRLVTDNGARHSLADVASDLGFDLDELRED